MFDFSSLMAPASLGLNIGSDVFGAISARSAANRQRELYKQMLAMFGRQEDVANKQRAEAAHATTPEAITAGSQALYQPMSTAATNEISRNLGSDAALHGVTPDSGQYNLLAARAFAGQEQTRQQAAVAAYLDAMRTRYGAYGGANNMMANAGQLLNQTNNAVGSPMGTSGGTGDALRTMMMLDAYRKAQGQPGTTQKPMQPGVAPDFSGQPGTSPTPGGSPWSINSNNRGGLDPSNLPKNFWDTGDQAWAQPVSWSQGQEGY